MNIAVIGIGGVGGYFGGKLTQLLKDERELKVFFVARGKHLEEIRKNGLVLDTDEGTYTCVPTLATDNIRELPELDLCLVCVKGYDLQNVTEQLKPLISGKTMILPLLNGVDIYERIRSVISNGVVFPSCVYVATHIERPGKVTQKGGACTIHFGKDPGNGYVDERIFEIFRKAGIKFNWTGNPYTEIWSKFMFIAPFGLATARYDMTIGEVLQSVEITGHVRKIMDEIYRIALKKEILLPETIIEDTMIKAASFPFETKTSFQRDYENRGKPDERDIFGGTIIRMGEKLGTGTETTSMIYRELMAGKTL